MKIFFNKNTFNVEVKEAREVGKYLGLMFKTRNTDNLLFKFKNYKTFGIHSYFVFFEFLAIWLDKHDNIVEYSIVKPFTLFYNSKMPSVKLLELPLNSRNKKIVKFLVGKRKI